MVAGKAAASETEQAKVEVKRGDLLKLSLSLDLHGAGELFHHCYKSFSIDSAGRARIAWSPFSTIGR